MSSWKLTVDDTNLAYLAIETPDPKLNILSKQVFQELDATLSELEKRRDVRGLVLASAKEESFVAGADIEEFLQMKSAADAAEASRQAQGLFLRLEKLPFPKVAAVHGACLGGGLELVLPFDARVASDSPKTAFAAPEVKLGILPAAGGTQRLPRVVGLANALDLNVSGRTINARQALKMGLVSSVVPREHLLRAARDELGRLSRREPPRPPKLPARLKAWVLEENPLGRLFLYRQTERALEKAGSHYPAPKAVLEAMRTGIEEGPDAGFAAESRLFGELALTEVSRELIRLFFATNEAKKDTGVEDRSVQAVPVRVLGVVGSGFMGGGIAQVAAEKGTTVRLRDVSPAMLGKALAGCRKAFEQKRKRGRMSSQDLQQTMDRLWPSTELAGFSRADLVIEAVFEDLELKHKVVSECEAALPPNAIFASNTSSIPISDIARASSRPDQVVGMHFFSPVPKMPLLEVIVTPKTAPWVTATAVAYGKRLGKTVIVVRDKTGFYTSRVLGFYLNEAALLVEEGADLGEVDRAMAGFGFPVGPFTLLDEVGLDIGTHVTRVMSQAFGDRLQIAETFARVTGDGRLGRKNKRGFYTYSGRKKQVDASVYALLPGGTVRRHVPAEEIQQRLWLVFAAECARCLEEAVLSRPRDGDLGAVLGLGFPPFLGGPFRYMDRTGIPRVAAGLEELAKRHGVRLAPPSILSRMAAKGETFYREG